MKGYNYFEKKHNINYSICWKQKNGIIIPYREMATSHLENTYAMLERKMCDAQNRTHDISDAIDVPDWVETAMDAIAKELGRRELKYKQKIEQDGEEDEEFIPQVL